MFNGCHFLNCVCDLYFQQIKRLFYKVLSEVCVRKDQRTHYGKACLFASQSRQKPKKQQNTIYVVEHIQ